MHNVFLSEETMKKILLIAMGGTISAHGTSRIDLKDYISGQLTGDDFLEHIPELYSIANIDVKQMVNVSSTAINEQHWITLQREITQALTAGYDGVVITHGTNTIEETAYFLHVTVPTQKPIVMVGAQRPFNAMSSDAQMNLLHAFRVAVHPDAYGKGVVVVANDEISCAREVTKTNTYRLETFQSGQFGYLGFIDPDNTVQFYRTPTRLHTYQSAFAQKSYDDMPRVGIIYSYAGATGDLIRLATEANVYDGIVMAGTGAGRCSPDEDVALAEAANKGVVIVRSSRVGNGRVVGIEHFNQYPVVCADNLHPQKARILLMLAMTTTNNITDIQTIFDTH